MAAPGGAPQEVNPIIVRRALLLDLPKYNGLTDPVRFLQIYAESCEVYAEIYPQDKLKLFPMALTGASQDWYYNQDETERTDCETVKRALITQFKPWKFMEDPFLLLSKIKMGLH